MRGWCQQGKPACGKSTIYSCRALPGSIAPCTPTPGIPSKQPAAIGHYDFYPLPTIHHNQIISLQSKAFSENNSPAISISATSSSRMAMLHPAQPLICTRPIFNTSPMPQSHSTDVHMQACSFHTINIYSLHNPGYLQLWRSSFPLSQLQPPDCRDKTSHASPPGYNPDQLSQLCTRYC